MLKVFNKLIDKNEAIDYCIGTIINEYDIHAAHPTACYFIYGKEFYDSLMAMDKLKRNTKIGIMMKNDNTLYPKLESYLKKWLNTFCEANNIDERNFISSTRDSVLLVNKKPIKTTFEDGLVKFVNKEGEYTTYIRLNNLEVLFDSMSNNLRIKGVNTEFVDSNPTFIRLMKQMLTLLEMSKTLPQESCLRKINTIRNKYINSKDPMMYASILRGNKFIYIIDGERVESDAILEEKPGVQLVRYDNYVNFILPLVKIYFRPH